MRELKEVKHLYDCLSTIFKWGPGLFHGKSNLVKFGFLTEVQVLVSSLVQQYEKAEKKGECEVALFADEMDDMMVMANKAGVFLSRAGDHDGAHFCFAIKNVYQFVLEEPDSKWDCFPTQREDHVRN